MHRIATLAVLIAALTGCQVVPSTSTSRQPQSGSINTGAIQTAIDYYVILQGAQTGIREVADDRRNMYLQFAGIVPSQMMFFDGDGLPLKVIRDGSLVGIPGLHQGVLIRHADAISFISVRARADAEHAPRVVESDAVLRMRRRLLVEGPAKIAMMKAIAALESGNETVAEDFKQILRDQQASGKEQAVPIAAVTAVKAPDLPAASIAPERPANWRSPNVPPNALPSAIDSEGLRGYVAFVDDSLRPVEAAPVVARLLRTAQRQPGVILVSGITPRNSTDRQIALAQHRAEFIHQIFQDEGLSKDRLTLTAVYRTNSHAAAQAKRPKASVGLTFLPAVPRQAAR